MGQQMNLYMDQAQGNKFDLNNNRPPQNQFAFHVTENAQGPNTNFQNLQGKAYNPSL